MSIRNCLFTLLTCITLVGCLVPEKFSASIVVKPDGAYTYKYEGKAVNGMAAMMIKEKGSLSEKEEQGLKSDAEKSAKNPNVKKFNYIGDGRYEILTEEELDVNNPPEILKVFKYSKDKDGVYTIEPNAMSAKDYEQLEALNIVVTGEAEVHLPDNAKVISNNATSTPSLFSKAYGWKIGSIADKPSIKFTLTP